MKSELAILWNREMRADIYRPQWVPTQLRDGRTVTAVTFEVHSEHRQYCGNLPCAGARHPRPHIEDMVARVAHLRGEDVAPSAPPMAAD